MSSSSSSLQQDKALPFDPLPKITGEWSGGARIEDGPFRSQV
ncbi:MAG: hypothetical protein OJF47_003895 [Nitrospira sp.]|nr:MAG: hypothetical protein OJF47_003895 [Nitrospira sp.]